MPLLYLSGAWLAGIFWGSLIAPPWEVIALGCFWGLAVAFLWWRDLLLRWICLSFVVLILGSLRYQSSIPTVSPQTLSFYNDKGPIEFRAFIAGEPDVRDRITNLRVEAREIWINGGWQKLEGKALLRVARYPEYQYGERIRVQGKPETPSDRPGFDYKSYLVRQGILSIASYPRIGLVERDQGNPILARILLVKTRLAMALAAALPEPQASLAQGMLLGIRSTIPSSLLEAFNRTGTTHIIAISGYNISLVGGYLLLLGTRLWNRRGAALLALLGIGFYTVLVGMNPPVMRAAIMGTLYVLGTYLGRQPYTLLGLALAAAVMAGFNPYLLWDVSFQLSFLATAGLVFLLPIFSSRMERYIGSPGNALWKPLVASVSVTCAATIPILPVLVLNFHLLSFITPVANLLALPAFPGIMLFSALVSGLGLIYSPLAQAVGWVDWLFLTYMIQVVKLGAALPFATLELRGIGEIWAGAYFLLVAGLLWLRRLDWSTIIGSLGKVSLRWVGVPLGVGALLVWLAVLQQPDDRIHISFFDVGQGDAILLQTPAHKILIDGGPSPQGILRHLGDRFPFWDREIDLLILTHPHDDHLAGLVEVVKRYQVKQVLAPAYVMETTLFKRWLELLEEKKVTYTLARAGQEVWLGENIRLAVLHPGSQLMMGTSSDANNNSVVLRLTVGGLSMLFSGDVEVEAQREILTRGKTLTSVILKVPHQGSRTALEPAFLAAVSPRLAVISVGKDNPFGHPAPETIAVLGDRGATVLRTDQRGDIEVIIDGLAYWVKTQR